MTKIPVTYDIDSLDDVITKSDYNELNKVTIVGDIHIKVIFKDNLSEEIRLKDYILFVSLYKESPEDLTYREFKEKMIPIDL